MCCPGVDFKFDLEGPSVWNSSLISSPLWFICKEEGVYNICYHGHLPCPLFFNSNLQKG